jgi:putative copper export protein
VVVALLRHRTGASIAGLVVRFSSVASLALLCVVVAGAAMTLLIIDDLDDLTDTVWGRRLTVKLIGVGIATLIGAYHHFVTVARLAAPGGATHVELARARTTLVVEALALAFVVVATGMLVNGSI